MPVVKIDLWKGRSPQQKKTLIEKVTKAVCEAISCPQEAVHIVINEVEKENWGIAGKPASEVFKE